MSRELDLPIDRLEASVSSLDGFAESNRTSEGCDSVVDSTRVAMNDFLSEESPSVNDIGLFASDYVVFARRREDTVTVEEGGGECDGVGG